jgi:hypothetical protein
MRFLPHLTNGGGFFVALIRKVAPMPAPLRRRARDPEPLAHDRAARLAAARKAGHELRPLGEAELSEVRRDLALGDGPFTAGGASPGEEAQLFTRSPATGTAADAAADAAPVAGGCAFAVAPRVADLLRSEPGRLAVVHSGAAVAKRRRGVWEEVELEAGGHMRQCEKKEI